MRLVHQRLEQAGLVAEMIIERGLGDLRVADDVLDRRGGVAGVGEMLQRRTQDLLPRLGRFVAWAIKTYRTVGKKRRFVK